VPASVQRLGAGGLWCGRTIFTGLAWDTTRQGCQERVKGSAALRPSCRHIREQLA
jgi:hypothetical protein